MLSKYKFDRFLAQLLPHLSPVQAGQVRDRINFLFPVDAKSSGPSWLLEGIYLELRRRGLMGRSSPPLSVLKSFDKDVQLKLTGAEAFLIEHIGDMTPPQKLRAATIAAEVLCNMLSGNGRSLSLRMVVVNLGNLPLALDRAFPGYAQAGLLGMLLSRKEPI
jgi:hypothetical protein